MQQNSFSLNRRITASGSSPRPRLCLLLQARPGPVYRVYSSGSVTLASGPRLQALWTLKTLFLSCVWTSCANSIGGWSCRKHLSDGVDEDERRFLQQIQLLSLGNWDLSLRPFDSILLQKGNLTVSSFAPSPPSPPKRTPKIRSTSGCTRDTEHSLLQLKDSAVLLSTRGSSRTCSRHNCPLVSLRLIVFLREPCTTGGDTRPFSASGSGSGAQDF